MDAADGRLTMLAHGVNQALIGRPMMDIRDASGRAFNHEIVAALSTVLGKLRLAKSGH
jgi:hypothetical protein